MPSQSALAPREINTPRKDSYRRYLDGLIVRLERDPALMFLLSAIIHFRTDDQKLRNQWERHWNEDHRTDGLEFDVDHNYWDRVWNMREKARAIIEGRRPWPPEFLPWKTARENRYYLGSGKRPPWLNYAPRWELIAESSDV